MQKILSNEMAYFLCEVFEDSMFCFVFVVLSRIQWSPMIAGERMPVVTMAVSGIVTTVLCQVSGQFFFYQYPAHKSPEKAKFVYF